MKVWVPGGKGMLGTAVCGHLSRRDVPHEGTGVEDVDITDSSAVNSFVESFQPTHVINCAAYTAVDDAEENEERAFSVNRDGVANVVAATVKAGAAIAHVSTDYVFDGTATEPYAVDAPTSPLGVYGASKLEGERAFLERVQGSEISWHLFRTSWVFGPGGKNFIATMVKLFQEKEEVRVVGDQRGRPSYTADLGAAILKMSGILGYVTTSGVYHYTNAGEATWHSFAGTALKIAQTLAADRIKCERVEEITTADYPTKAKRPMYSVLDTRGTPVMARHWREALLEYVSRLLAEGT